jgi:hypothetical protein
MELDSLSIYWNHVKKDELFGGLNFGDLAVSVKFNIHGNNISVIYINIYIY